MELKIKHLLKKNLTKGLPCMLYNHKCKLTDNQLVEEGHVGHKQSRIHSVRRNRVLMLIWTYNVSLERNHRYPL